MKSTWGSAILLGMTLAALAIWAGCTTDELSDDLQYRQILAAGEDPPEDLFHGDLEFYRRYSKKKWLRDRDLEFTIKKKSRVKAVATFRNVIPGQTYTVHLTWIRPDGREMYRRFAEATVTPTDSTGYVAEVVIKKSRDLSYRRVMSDTYDTPRFSVDSQFNISRDKNRETGQYQLRVYLDRTLIREETFTVVGS